MEMEELRKAVDAKMDVPGGGGDLRDGQGQRQPARARLID